VKNDGLAHGLIREVALRSIPIFEARHGSEFRRFKTLGVTLPEFKGGWVYLLQALTGTFGPVKIGMTIRRNPFQRMAGFQTVIPVPLRCIGLRSDARPYSIECELHRRFAAKRTHGEWFTLSPADIDELLTTEGFDIVRFDGIPVRPRRTQL
jgi:hypothetical protein